MQFATAEQIKINGRTNNNIREQLYEYPDYAFRCRLSEICYNRGVSLADLSIITGIRIATLSELANGKRSQLSIPHFMVLAKALRLTDIGELFELVMSNKTRRKFEEDQEEIEKRGLLESQEEYLKEMKKELKEKKKEKELEKQMKKAHLQL